MTEHIFFPWRLERRQNWMPTIGSKCSRANARKRDGGGGAAAAQEGSGLDGLTLNDPSNVAICKSHVKNDSRRGVVVQRGTSRNVHCYTVD